eukprot:800024-Rhodomonas_salina.5
MMLPPTPSIIARVVLAPTPSITARPWLASSCPVLTLWYEALVLTRRSGGSAEAIPGLPPFSLANTIFWLLLPPFTLTLVLFSAAVASASAGTRAVYGSNADIVEVAWLLLNFRAHRSIPRLSAYALAASCAALTSSVYRGRAPMRCAVLTKRTVLQWQTRYAMCRTDRAYGATAEFWTWRRRYWTSSSPSSLVLISTPLCTRYSY